MTTDLPYRVRRSDRAHRVRVSVDARGEVEVVLPRRSPERAAAAAIVELRPWIDRRLAEASVVREQIAARGDALPYLGGELVLRREPGRSRVHRRGDELLVPAGERADAAIERWYRRAAEREIAPRLDAAVAALGTRYAKLTIRNQRTRWGSCSSTGAMSFNWRLLLAPEGVLDYVVWHEACHLRVMDHSTGFWSLVERYCPDYEDHRRWLRRHGTTLVL
ncbi:MAG TPA: SprT family zinc-dependent metalloprotease [Solirubrobacteraceae bacterium]|jgi:predicted metal-dependent hydrolase|nr:SprT family zinc-dependent metalloprotease [Solirubrobacteraceae bacterium]